MMSDLERAAETISARGIGTDIDTAIVLGPGMRGLLEGLDGAVKIPFADLPGFPKGDGLLIAGAHDGVKALYLFGCPAFHETGDSAAMAGAIETLALTGVRNLVITAGAASVRADFYPGHLVLLTDHISFAGPNPLCGAGGDGGLINMTDAYDKKLIRRLKRATISGGVSLHEGVFMWFTGPTYETPAEVKVARVLGADVMGMGVAPEVILARRVGLNAAAIAVVTHFGAGFSGGDPSQGPVMQQAQAGAIGLKRIVRAFLKTRESAWGASGAST